MMVPDYALIAEIMLFSEGFKGAKTLARKMVSPFFEMEATEGLKLNADAIV